MQVTVVPLVVPMGVFMNEGLVRVPMPVSLEEKQGHSGHRARSPEEEGRNGNLAKDHE